MISIIVPYIRPKGFERLVRSIKEHSNKVKYEIVAKEDKKRIGCPKMVKRLVAKTKYDLVMFLCDDVVLENDVLGEALKKMREFKNGWGLVSLGGKQHWLAHKRLLRYLGGEFFHTGYLHNYCDDELVVRCKEMGRYKIAHSVKLEHLHPVFGKAESDNSYEWVKKTAQKDYDYYMKRVLSNYAFRNSRAE